MELKKIKCPSCGGKLDIPEDSDEMICGFCGSKVIIDDKATEVGRIKKAELRAKKELDEHELENKKKNDDYNDEREYKKKKNTGKLKGWAIALTIICLLFTFTAFRDGKILSGLIGIVQVAAFGYATLLCLDVLPEKITNLHKIVFIGGCILMVPYFALGSVQIGGGSYTKPQAEDLDWSEYVLSDKLPEPKTLKGRLYTDSSSSLSLYIMDVDKDEYKDYVSACRDKGYTVDISNSSTSFSATNEEGYYLRLYYDENDKEYSINLSEPKKESTSDETKEESKTTTTTKDEKQKTDTNNNGLRPDFKKAMDDYESFMNEYVKFMKKYSANPSDTSLLKDYTNYMTKYSKAMESFEKWDEEDMNDAETKYYLEVQKRVNKKLSEVQ
jgi:DNA-directed RNA polymerase subunit RPC12/RpoP